MIDLGDFQTTATNRADFFRDLTDYALRSYATQGLVPPSLGVSKPATEAPIEDAAGFLNTVNGWFTQQRAVKGGGSTDGFATPVQETYRERRYQWLSKEEGLRPYAYDDATGQQVVPGKGAKGNVTVGIGFNMDAPDNPALFARALPGVDFEAVKDGRLPLNEAQIQRLFDATVSTTERQVAQKLAGMDLSEHQRLALVSLAYNRPAALDEIASAAQQYGPDGILATILSQPGSASRRFREAGMFVGHIDAPQVLGDPQQALGHMQAPNVDPRLTSILNEAAGQLPQGYTVQITSGFRDHSRVAGTGGVSQHALGRAVDVQIIGPDGPIPNKGEDATGLYTQLARAALLVQQEKHPTLSGRLAWGGNFTTGPANGPKDLMHFDLGGDRGRFGRLADLARR